MAAESPRTETLRRRSALRAPQVSRTTGNRPKSSPAKPTSRADPIPRATGVPAPCAAKATNSWRRLAREQLTKRRDPALWHVIRHDASGVEHHHAIGITLRDGEIVRAKDD